MEIVIYHRQTQWVKQIRYKNCQSQLSFDIYLTSECTIYFGLTRPSSGTCIRGVLGWNFGRTPIILSFFFHGVCKPLQVNAVIVP
jgi:hypothetical protein